MGVRCEIVGLRQQTRHGWSTADVATLLVMILHLSASHLLFKLTFEELNLKLQLLIVLLMLGLIFSSDICTLLKFFLVFVLQSANLVLLGLDCIPHQLLFFVHILLILLGYLGIILSTVLQVLSLLSLLFKIEAFLLPL